MMTGISPSELAGVCARYDIGDVRSARPFMKGSGSAPKVLLETSSGQYLLKRRASGAGRDDPFRVALSHEVQLYLAERHFPVAELIGTRGDHNSMLQLSGRVYEMFRFVAGEPDDLSDAAASASGAALARLHSLLGPRGGFRPTRMPPSAMMQASTEILRRLETIPTRTGDQETLGPVAKLSSAYRDAWQRATEAGVTTLPRQLVHGDWHPGNMLFAREGERTLRLVAVVDFDSARLAPRVADLASGALQFGLPRGITAGSSSPDGTEQNPPGLVESRVESFLSAYHAAAESAITHAEAECVPWLMTAALIAETAVPIAATGRLGRVDGPTFLRLAEQKARWLVEHRLRLAGMTAGKTA